MSNAQANGTFSDPAARSGVCVVIPARNEETLIGRCVASVLDAGLDAARVYAIDDASTDRTGEVLRGFAGVNVLRNEPRRGKAGSLRHAIEHFGLVERYAFVAILDADSHVAPGYFDAVVKAFTDDPEAVLVCGAPRGQAHNYLTASRTLDYALCLWMYRKGQDRLGVITVAPGCASTYRSAVLDSLDWDGGTLVEDMDLTVQIHRKRLGRIRYAVNAVVYTQDPRRLREYVGQLTRWYSGTWQVMRLHRLPLGRQRLDAEFALLIAEGLFYSVMVLALPVLASLWPTATLRWLLLDQGISALAAVACAWHLRRVDVLLWFPTFAPLRVIGCVVWLRTFWLEVVRRQTLRTWFSVARYDSNAQPPYNTGRSLA
ncbi:MAG TPA: glycosyltransferase family 2 protein [Vicinamibacterales bacterium]|nr:glycosyltransferase family 2 protein [Vicinamibacterales bacterium]